MLRLRAPGDKSITHRALILAGLATGRSRLRGLLDGADARSTAAVLRALGVGAPETLSGDVVLNGRGLRGLRGPAALDCGNSGTTARLMLGVLSAQPLEATLDGDASLRSRPMRRVTGPLRRMGATFDELGEPDRLPVRVRGGPLATLDYESPVASAQVKSAILLAGLCGGVPVSVVEPARSRDHTERMLSGVGVGVVAGVSGRGAGVAREDSREGEEGEGGWRVRLEPVASIPPLDLVVPGDFSSAAFLLGVGLLGAGDGVVVEGVGVNPTRTGLLDVLERMGGGVALEERRLQGGEPVADLVARPARLRGVEVAGREVPALIDEVPLLAVLAARAEGETRITGAGELRVKESDRIAVLAANLRRIGVEAEELRDGLVVVGTDAPLRGRIDCHGDHRIAMAFGVLGREAANDLRIDEPGAAAVSFPGFWELLDHVGRNAPP